MAATAAMEDVTGVSGCEPTFGQSRDTTCECGWWFERMNVLVPIAGKCVVKIITPRDTHAANNDAMRQITTCRLVATVGQ